jgi:hypothetical protein
LMILQPFIASIVVAIFSSVGSRGIGRLVDRL